MSEYDGEEPEFDDTPVCQECGLELDWTECGACDGTGLVDLNEEDAINFDPYTWSRCEECHGRGGWLECPAPEEHARIREEKEQQPHDN